MLIETFKGVDIHHDAKHDEFFTNIVINVTNNGKKEYIRNIRLQKTRDDIQKFLNTAAKKPIVKKAWLREDDEFILVEIILFNNITKKWTIKRSEKERPEEFGEKRYGRSQLYIKCRENDAIVADLKKKFTEIEKVKKTTSCSMGKLIQLSDEHCGDDD